MSDYLVKALAYDGMARVYAAVTTETIKEAQRRHDTWSVSSAALGRTMTGTLFLGAMQKEDQKIALACTHVLFTACSSLGHKGML